MKKKTINILSLTAFIFTFAFILTGCSKSADTKETSAGTVAEETSVADKTGENDRSKTSTADTNAEDGNEEVLSETPKEIKLLHPVSRSTNYVSSVKNEDETKSMSFHYKSSGMKLNDEEAKEYSKLNKSLADAYELNDGQYAAICDDMRKIAEDLLDDYDVARDGYYELENYYEASIVRADNVLFSVNMHNELFYGKNNQKYYDYGITYDTRTGKILSLADIAANVDTVKSGIKAELYEKYTGYKLDEAALDSEIEALLKGSETVGSSWNVDYTGLNLIFNEYCIADASEQLNIRLGFNKYPDAVKDVCKLAPEKYVKYIVNPAAGNMYADIGNNGEFTSISVTGSQYNDYDYGNVVITLTGADGQSTSGEFEAYSFYIDPYYVKCGDRHFLYIFESYENDYTINAVFEITGGEIKEQGAENLYLPSTWYNGDDEEDSKFKNYDEEMFGYYTEWLLLSDPMNMILASKCDMLSTYSIERKYVAGENGMPESNEIYRCDSYIHPTALKSIAALETDADGNETGAKLEIKPGDELEFYMTDNASFVIFVLSDGRYAKVNAETDSYPDRINGEDVEEVLKGIGYAG